MTLNAKLLFALWGSLALIAAVISAVVLTGRAKRRRCQQLIDRRHQQSYLVWHRQLEQSGEIATVDCPLMLSEGEVCLWVEPMVTLFELKPVSHSTHTFVTVPFGGGQIDFGEGVSTTETTEEWRPVAAGRLYVTDRRIYFDASPQIRQVVFGQISTIRADYSAIEVASGSSQKVMVFSGLNGQVVRDIVRYAVEG